MVEGWPRTGRIWRGCLLPAAIGGLTLSCLQLSIDHGNHGSAGESRLGLPDASHDHLPRWRGFNLLNKFALEWSNGPFDESDFALISELDFNFVRLPLDYRTLIVGQDWERFDMQALAEVDQAVEWGGDYGLHVNLNLHRIPGYCVNPPAEPLDLWNDAEALRVAALHWAELARRYRGIDNRRLSFNLINEPPDMPAAEYRRVIEVLAEAVRSEDPKRLIIVDGLAHGRRPVAELIALRVAQSARGYAPFGLTHYRADWVEGSRAWPTPAWPAPPLNGYLYGNRKPDLAAPLRLDLEFDEPAVLRMRVHRVSDRARLLVRADGEIVFDRLFVCGPGSGEWRESRYREEWDIYQNLYGRDYQAEIPEGAGHLQIEVAEGDWLQIAELSLRLAQTDGRGLVLKPTMDWGQPPGRLAVEAHNGELRTVEADPEAGRRVLWRETVEPWLRLREQGVGVMVGEWGVYRHTPHDVALRWMTDCLRLWQEAGFGWALWNFRGPFGPLDSRRADVEYEEWRGFLVDREMLDLLRRH